MKCPHCGVLLTGREGRSCRVCGGELTSEVVASARAERALYRDPSVGPNNLGDTAKFERIDLTDNQSRSYVAPSSKKREREKVVPLGPVFALLLTVAAIVGVFATGILKPPELPQIVFPSESSQSAVDDTKAQDGQESQNKDTRPVFAAPKVKKSIASYTWGELAAISAMMTDEGTKSGARSVAKEYNLMSKKGKLTKKTRTIKLSNGTKVKVRLAGIYHDMDEDGHMIGLTFVATAPAAKHAINGKLNTKGGWKKSDMRSYLNSNMFGKLPKELQDLVVPAMKETNNKGYLAKVGNVTETKDKLWLLSFGELCGKITKKTMWYEASDVSNYRIYNAEGRQYQCFKEMGVRMDDPSGSALLYSYKGKHVNWWLRSPHPNSTKSWHIVTTEVDQTNCKDCTRSAGVVFGFCI